MNRDQISGQWKQYRGKIGQQWGKLTDSEVEEMKGSRDQLVGRIQEKYGVAKDEAERQLDEFGQSL